MIGLRVLRFGTLLNGMIRIGISFFFLPMVATRVLTFISVGSITATMMHILPMAIFRPITS